MATYYFNKTFDNDYRRMMLNSDGRRLYNLRISFVNGYKVTKFAVPYGIIDKSVTMRYRVYNIKWTPIGSELMMIVS